MNRDVSRLLGLKLLAMSINLLPLICSHSSTMQSSKSRSHGECKIETSLKILACRVGGIDQSSLYEDSPCTGQARTSLIGWDTI